MRFKLQDITIRRIYEAIRRRIENIPDKYNWTYSTLGMENQERLQQYKNIHKGEQCFLMANGPSLGKMDLTQLRGKITFGLNRIYLIFDKIGFEPKYYIANNELILEQFHSDINKLRMPKFLGWNRRHFFLGHENKYPDNTFYLKIALSVKDDFSTNITQNIFSGGTVTYQALQLIFFMGFKQVIIIGLDHNFAEKGVPSKTLARTTNIDVNHFHPDYWPKGSVWQLPDLPRTDLAYKMARLQFEAEGREIIDATVGGKCNIFKKGFFDDYI